MNANRKLTRSKTVTDNELLPISPEVSTLPVEDDNSGMSSLLFRLEGRAPQDTPTVNFGDDADEYDYIGKEALYRMVEDLQFGHDLRL